MGKAIACAHYLAVVVQEGQACSRLQDGNETVYLWLQVDGNLEITRLLLREKFGKYILAESTGKAHDRGVE